MSARLELADAVADAAERAVQVAEADVAAARDATVRDIAETRLREVLAAQDEALEQVGPTIEERRVAVRDAAWEAIRSLRGDPAADWCAKHRKFMSPAVKAWLIGRLGRRVYERAFPW